MRQRGGVNLNNPGDKGYFIVYNNNNPNMPEDDTLVKKTKVGKSEFEDQYDIDIGTGNSSRRDNRTITLHKINGAHYLYYVFNNDS
jgi:hypothetical protein